LQVSGVFPPKLSRSLGLRERVIREFPNDYQRNRIMKQYNLVEA